MQIKMSKPFSIENIKSYSYDECFASKEKLKRFNKECMPLIGPTSIGSVSYMFAKFGHMFNNAQEFIDNVWTNLDLYDKNPINCEYGRDKDYLYNLTMKYSSITGEDPETCWKDLLFHAYYQTKDGKEWERKAIESISKIPDYKAEYADHVSDYGYSIDLFLFHKNERVGLLQIKPISSFCNNDSWTYKTRDKLYKNFKRALKKYNLPTHYVIYDSKQNGWLVNKDTNNVFWELTKLVNVNDSFKIFVDENKTPLIKSRSIISEEIII